MVPVIKNNFKKVNNEKNIPTKQEKTKKDSWFSCQNENYKRSQINQPSQTTRKKGSISISNAFHKNHRLLKKKEFIALIKQRNRLVGKYLCIDVFPNFSTMHTKIGLSVSRKYGNSVQRNKFKRAIREIFRTNKHIYMDGWAYHVLPRSDARKANHQDLKEEFLKLVKNYEHPPEQAPATSSTNN